MSDRARTFPVVAFDQRWSKEQREAVIAAVCDHGMTNQQASDAAHKGSLPGIGMGLEPFPMSRGTIADYTGEEKRRRQALARAAAAPDTVLAEGIGTLAQMFGDRVADLARKSKPDMVEAAKVAKAGREILALQRDLQRATSKQPSDDPAPTDPKKNGAKPSGFVGSLLS